MIILIVVIVKLISIFSYCSIFKNKKYNWNISMLRVEYSKESNIQKLKTRSSLKKIIPNINIIFIKLSLKLCK